MSLLARRCALLSAINKGGLPSTYQQVEYLESAGRQYINTNYYANTNTKAEILAETTQNDTFKYILGQGSTTVNTAFYVGQGSASPYYIFSNISNEKKTTYSNLSSYNTKRKVSLSKKGLYVDDILQKDYSNIADFTSSYSLYLFGKQNTTVLSSGVRIYFAKIYDNDILVRYFIPCYRKADNIAGMYDLVNGNFYTNQGTGEFILGGEV